MKYYAGLDVSMKSTAICIVDEQGKVIHESMVKTDPILLADAIEITGLRAELVGLESGSLSHYLIEGLRRRLEKVVCIDSKKMNAILSLRVNKTDKNDARGIADALRTGMFTQVHQKSQEAVDRGAVLTMRRSLVKQRMDTKNHIRGILKAYGIRLGAVGPKRFNDTVKLHIQPINLLVQQTMEMVLELFDLLTEQISQIDKKLTELARADEDTKLLMTAHGVGPITALTFKSEIDDPRRFSNSRAVGAYLGMTPKQYSSGETYKQGRISKCGSKELRSLLTEAGLVVLTRSKKWSKLKAWGLKLMRRKGMKKASLAVGRKLAIIMHRMLIDRSEFVWGEKVDQAA